MLMSVIPWHSKFCQHHGLIYLPSFGRIAPNRSANWDRFPLLIETLKAGFANVVIWLDADAVIQNPYVNLLECTNEFLFCGMVKHDVSWRDTGFHWNAGVMYLRRHVRTIEFLEEVNRVGRMPEEGWDNQGTIHAVAKRMNFPICTIQNKWNASRLMNDVPNPIVRAFHGEGVACAPDVARIAENNLLTAYR